MDVIDSICSKERIQEDHVIELFTHEGYPINVNSFNEDCKLKIKVSFPNFFQPSYKYIQLMYSIFSTMHNIKCLSVTGD